MLAPLDLVTRPPLRIRYLPGSGARLVVSFSGVGNKRHEEPPLEFFRLAHGLGKGAGQGENHVLFVTDESRSWMNAPGLAEAVAATVTETAARIGASRVVAIGNSMGASAALILAALIPVDTVVAFVPQVSVHPDIVPEETRWTHFRNRITVWPHPQVPDLAGRATDVTVLHGTSADEMVHVARFPAMTSHFLVPGQDHRLARALHAQGRLAPIITNAIAGRHTRARDAVRAAGGQRRAQYEQKLRPHPIEEMTR
jgi:pimeloyl-ACP methyl ester carboxylesterase